MDDQKPQDQENQNQPVDIAINDIVPPPAEETEGQRIKVTLDSENNTESENIAEEVKPVVTTEEPAVDEITHEEEQLSPVTAPPEEKSLETTEEQAHEVEENTVSNDFSQHDETTATPSAPAEMGVAASQMKAQKHSHRNNKKLATIVTVVTALILSGTAVYVYMSANKNTDSDNNSKSTQINESSNETEQTAVQPAVVGDIDQTIAEVEESLSTLDDSADFKEESLSNETLGL